MACHFMLGTAERGPRGIQCKVLGPYLFSYLFLILILLFHCDFIVTFAHLPTLRSAHPFHRLISICHGAFRFKDGLNSTEKIKKDHGSGWMSF